MKEVKILSVKGQILSILGFTGHVVSVAVILLCSSRIKAATEKMEMNGHGSVPIKLAKTDCGLKLALCPSSR